MPIPKPKSGEDKNDFISRCVSEISSDYPDNKQAVAICISTWETETGNKYLNTKKGKKK